MEISVTTNNLYADYVRRIAAASGENYHYAALRNISNEISTSTILTNKLALLKMINDAFGQANLNAVGEQTPRWKSSCN